MSRKNSTNGMSVLGRRNGVIFVRLPPELQAPIDSCICPYCKAHPDQPPMWDTLAVAQEDTPCRRNGHTWTVHMPDWRDAIVD